LLCRLHKPSTVGKPLSVRHFVVRGPLNYVILSPSCEDSKLPKMGVEEQSMCDKALAPAQVEYTPEHNITGVGIALIT